MKAIVYHQYGSPDVLELKEIDKPAVKDNEVLVRIHAAAVSAGDWRLVRGLPYLIRIMGFGLLKPKHNVPGFDLAGQVEAVGRGVKQLKPGDEVFGQCRGAFAEYGSVEEDELALKPVNLTFEQAASVTISATTALQALRDVGRVQPGQRVLIIGASGGVGTFAVQIARSFGADVAGVCSTRNLDLVRSIGAGHVIDYTREDFAGNGQRYDLILDTVGNRTLSDCRRALRPGGTLVLVGGTGGPWLGGVDRSLKALVLSPFTRVRMRPFISMPTRDDLLVLKGLIESGKVTPVIDRRYPLSQTAEAVRYVETGHARGKVVITM